MSVLFTYLSSAGEAWGICPTLDWDNPFHDTNLFICRGWWKHLKVFESRQRLISGKCWRAHFLIICLIILKLLSKLILSMYCIWHNKMKHLNIVLTHPTVRECLAQFEDLKVQFQSECHVKEKEVSLYFECSFNAYCNTLSLCSCCD